MSNGGGIPKGNGSRQSKRPAPLRMVKEEVRQIRLPVIIHTHSPKILHVDPAHFSKIVQELTGRGQKRKPEASPRVPAYESACPSPTSSAESGLAGILEGANGLMSPRTPLPSFDHLFSLDSFLPPMQPSPDKTNSKVLPNPVLAAAARTAAHGVPPYSQFFPGNFNGFPHIFSPIPSPNVISPGFLAELPVLSPSMHPAFDSYGSYGSHHAVLPSPGYGRFSTSNILPSPGASNAFLDMLPMIRE